jgi:hypothetical protein
MACGKFQMRKQQTMFIMPSKLAIIFFDGARGESAHLI